MTIEVTACRPWLLAKLDAIRPKLIITPGATAARSLLGAQFRLMQERGRLTADRAGRAIFPTIHPPPSCGQETIGSTGLLQLDFRTSAAPASVHPSTEVVMHLRRRRQHIALRAGAGHQPAPQAATSVTAPLSSLAPLPKGGGEPGTVFFAYVDAFRRGDGPAISKLSTARSTAEIEQIKELLPIARATLPMNIRVTKAGINGKRPHCRSAARPRWPAPDLPALCRW